MNKAFEKWLADEGNREPFSFVDNGLTYLVIRLQKTPDIDYLFSQYSCSQGLTNEEAFNYVGLYCKKDSLIYDVKYPISIIGKEATPRSRKALGMQLQTSVREKVEAIIKNDRKNLMVTDITDKCLLCRKEYNEKYGAREKARESFLNDVDMDSIRFRCGYVPDSWREKSLIAYIEDPEGYAEKEAKSYIASFQEHMLCEFMFLEAVIREYKDIISHAEYPVHAVKKIMAAMQTTRAKTVRVTIVKKGVEFTFITDADILRKDPKESYYTWGMPATYRRKFEKLFGISEHFYPQEIVCITYDKKILYEA